MCPPDAEKPQLSCEGHWFVRSTSIRTKRRPLAGDGLIAQAPRSLIQYQLKRTYSLTMDTSTLLLAILTATLASVSFHAWRLGNEKRDVTLLGVFSGLCGVGTAVTGRT
jgi:hypothetical protein